MIKYIQTTKELNNIYLFINSSNYKYKNRFKKASNISQMTQLLISQGQLLHNILIQSTNRNITRISQIHGLSQSLNTLFMGFTNSINNAIRNMFKKLKFDEEEDPTIIFLSKFTVDLLGELSKKFNFVGKKIKNQVFDPLQQFLYSQRESYTELIFKSGELFTNIEENSSFVNQLNKNFSENKSEDLSKQQQIDMKKVFENEMKKCNQNWLQIKKGYKKLLAQADSINSFRCNFTVKMQVKTCKILNRMVSSPHVQQALAGYEQLCDQNETLSIYVKERIRDSLGKCMLLQEKTMEEFDGMNQFAYKQKSIIDDFISIFTSFSSIKQDEAKHEKARSLILSNFHWATYFLNRLRANLHTQIKLPGVKYHEMTTIIKYLFATCAQQQKNQQTIYNLMYISYRMNHNGNYIIKQLGKHDSYWENPERWYGLIQYLKNTRDDTIVDKKNNRNQKIKKAFKTGLNWLAAYNNSNNKVSTEKKIRSQKIIADARAYDILCEMNYFMSRLELKEKFIFDFIVEASAYYAISTQNKKKLLKFHYFNKQNSNTKGNANYLKRKRHIEQKYKNIQKQKMICICIGKCLPFLQANSKLLQLRLVCNLWSRQLKQKICKRYLILQPQQSLSKIRMRVYSAFCPSAITHNIFQRMLEQLPSFTEHSDIIQLDARRSLAWDQSLRETLVVILKCFAFFHPNIGYLQGMNYLCENILKLSDEKFQVYRIFEFLMNNPFQGMYSANFDGLRTKIYQFMRIVQRQKPKLYDHFETQKLQGQHFILPWAITLWGEMSGDLCWVLWDGFICKGWKWWFKTMLWLLNILQAELLTMNFQQMMKCFSQLSTGLLNMNTKQLKDFGIDLCKAKLQIDKIQIHGDLLKDIEKQYKIRVQMVNQYLKRLSSPREKKKLFK